jgi:hypothetical protein
MIAGFSIGCGLAVATALHALAAELPMLTSLSDRRAGYTVADKPYVVLQHGDVEAAVVNNQAVDDAILPGHRAGYSGIASLKHTRQPRNLFVPAYAGLNFEHILDGTAQERRVLFEPRNAPMQLRIIDGHTVELYQAPTPHYGVESCHRFTLRKDGVIEMAFECIPRRMTWRNGYLLFFWASYVDQPASLDIHFLGRTDGDAGAPRWIRGVTPKHGVDATHRALGDERDDAHVEPFPLELPFSFSRHRYAQPWYFGVCRGMAFAQAFRAADGIRFTQSPSGGGPGCPAWDFQWIVPKCQVNQRYGFRMRAFYAVWPPDANEAEARETLRRRANAWD